jgi:cyanophycin synthetase
VDENASVRFELERQGYNADSIPSQGKNILVQRNGNVAFDVTDEVHPEVAATVALAARIVGLDIAGVDLVATDISRPLAEQGAAIVEINAGPSLLMHLKPATGKARPVGKAIIDNLFAEGESGRIPVVGISGTDGKSLAAQLVAKLLHLRGNYVGLACADGLYFAQRPVSQRDSANWGAAQKVLLNRSVEAAVIENSCDTILSEGLGYDRCQVGVITNLDVSRHFGKYHIETEEQVCNVLRTQVDVVLGDGVAVLNADDALVAVMAEYSDGEVMYFSRHASGEPVTAHLQKGGRAVIVSDGRIVLATGNERPALIELAHVPVLANSKDKALMESVLAAIAAAWALNVSPLLMRAGLTTFEAAPANTKDIA